VDLGDPHQSVYVFGVLLLSGMKIRNRRTKLPRFNRQQFYCLRQRLVPLHQPLQAFIDRHDSYYELLPL